MFQRYDPVTVLASHLLSSLERSILSLMFLYAVCMAAAGFYTPVLIRLETRDFSD